jgi:hypothetical protein
VGVVDWVLRGWMGGSDLREVLITGYRQSRKLSAKLLT